MRYNIIRYYFNGKKELIRCGVTVEEAQRHCMLVFTKRKGKYFDGYEKQTIRHIQGI